jgi:hypothetical protein
MSIPSIVPIYFFYGLAFFSMGLLVMLEGGRSSDVRLRRALRPLAAFGLIHAANEWLEMFQSVAEFGGHTFPDWMIGLRLGMLAFSFISLAAFGSYLMVISRTAWRLILLVPLGLESCWVFGLLLLKAITPLPFYGVSRITGHAILWQFRPRCWQPSGWWFNNAFSVGQA